MHTDTYIRYPHPNAEEPYYGIVVEILHNRVIVAKFNRMITWMHNSSLQLHHNLYGSKEDLVYQINRSDPFYEWVSEEEYLTGIVLSS